MSYKEYSSFLENEIDSLLTQNLDVSGSSIRLPKLKQITEELSKELIKRSRDTFSTSNQDSILNSVKDLESAKALEQLKTVIELVGDLQRDAIGSSIHEVNNKTMVYSLKSVREDIPKLPKMALMDGESDDVHVLQEYNSLRQTLIEKNNVLALGERKEQEIQLKLDKLERLVKNVQKTHGNVQEYFTGYKDRVIEEALELRHLLEKAIESASVSEERKHSLYIKLKELDT